MRYMRLVCKGLINLDLKLKAGLHLVLLDGCLLKKNGLPPSLMQLCCFYEGLNYIIKVVRNCS